MARTSSALAVGVLLVLAGCAGVVDSPTTTPAGGYVKAEPVESAPANATVYGYGGDHVGESSLLETAFRRASNRNDSVHVGVNGSEVLRVDDRLPDAESRGDWHGHFVSYRNQTYRVALGVAATE